MACTASVRISLSQVFMLMGPMVARVFMFMTLGLRMGMSMCMLMGVLVSMTLIRSVLVSVTMFMFMLMRTFHNSSLCNRSDSQHQVI